MELHQQQMLTGGLWDCRAVSDLIAGRPREIISRSDERWKMKAARRDAGAASGIFEAEPRRHRIHNSRVRGYEPNETFQFTRQRKNEGWP